MKYDIEESEVKEYKELSYKLFQLRDHEVRSSNGEFRCPFCAAGGKGEDGSKYSHLLRHAIRVAEGSISGKQRGKHAAMARYLAVDLGNEVNADDDKQLLNVEECVPSTSKKRSRSDSSKKNNSTSKAVQKSPRRKPRASLAQKTAIVEKREKEALDKVSELKRKIDEMSRETIALITKERSGHEELMKREKEALDKASDLERKIKEMNALITKERSSNDELQRVATEATKREKEALDKFRESERKITNMRNTLVTKERTSNDELQRVRRELMKRESEALDKVRELERKISEINALVTKERTSNCEMQRVHKGLMKRESDALVKVRYLENKINEMNDEMNALITKERSSNDELQRVRNELMKEKAKKNLFKDKEESERAYWSLLAREQKCNAELQEARKELLMVVNDSQRGNNCPIGIKQMGKIDMEVLKRVCGKKFRTDEAETGVVALCSSWQKKLKDLEWDPFHNVKDDKGYIKRVVNEEDESLRSFKQHWGGEAYSAVVMALEELHEYNPSGRCVVPELWNFNENRKAKLDEIIRCFFTTTRNGVANRSLK